TTSLHFGKPDRVERVPCPLTEWRLLLPGALRKSNRPTRSGNKILSESVRLAGLGNRGTKKEKPGVQSRLPLPSPVKASCAKNHRRVQRGSVAKLRRHEFQDVDRRLGEEKSHTQGGGT